MEEQKKAIFRLVRKAILDLCKSDQYKTIEKKIPKLLIGYDDFMCEYVFKASKEIGKVINTKEAIVFGFGIGKNHVDFDIKLPFTKIETMDKVSKLKYSDDIYL